MSSDQHLSPPAVLVDYDGIVEVQVKYDEVCLCRKQGHGDIIIQACPVEPLVLLQTISNGGKPQGPLWAYDHDKEDWVTYDERLHEVPQSWREDLGRPYPEGTDVPKFIQPDSSALVDAGTAEPAQLDLSSSDTVELSSEVAPAVRDLPVAEDVEEEELDEPSDDAYEDEEEQ